MKNHHWSCIPKSEQRRKKKYKRGQPKVIHCRHNFPRPIVQKAHFTPEGRIELRRLSHWINNYNNCFAACLRCNHDIKTMWGTDTNQMTALVYMTNYMTKINRTLFNTIISVQVMHSYNVDYFNRFLCRQRWTNTKGTKTRTQTRTIQATHGLC
jgi:hypothetical protein